MDPAQETAEQTNSEQAAPVSAPAAPQVAHPPASALTLLAATQHALKQETKQRSASAPAGSKKPPVKNYSHKKVHENSRAMRRGPMDEMRQLVRVLVKLMPTSEPLLKTSEADNGGEQPHLLCCTLTFVLRKGRHLCQCGLVLSGISTLLRSCELHLCCVAGNKITEKDIKQYLEVTLGDAPQPAWGLPDGWDVYLACASAMIMVLI